MRLRKGVGLLGARFELRALLLHELALVLVEFGFLQQAIKLLQLSRVELVDMVRDELLENPILEDGTEVEARGDQEIEYDGEMHTAANLFDALKEGYYGKF